MQTPEETVRAMLDSAARLWNGDRAQVDVLTDFYSADADVRHPMAPLGGDAPIRGRDALRSHFGAAGQANGDNFRVDGIRIHQGADPDVVVAEFAYRGDGDWSVPGVIVFRIRDGLIVESRDYFDPIALARVTGGLDDLCAQLSGA